MGWGRMLLLGDWGQQMDIQDQQRELEMARVQLEGQQYTDARQDERIAELSAENQNLRLYVYGLVRLLERKGAISPEEVRQLVDGIEGPDGEPR